MNLFSFELKITRFRHNNKIIMKFENFEKKRRYQCKKSWNSPIIAPYVRNWLYESRFVNNDQYRNAF